MGSLSFRDEIPMLAMRFSDNFASDLKVYDIMAMGFASDHILNSSYLINIYSIFVNSSCFVTYNSAIKWISLFKRTGVNSI